MKCLNVTIVLLSWFFLILQPNSAARILAVVPTPAYSHQNAYYPLWIELSLRGHEVTLITTDIINNSTLTNLTEIDVHDVAYEYFNKKIQGFLEIGSPSFFSMIKLWCDFQIHTIDKILDHAKVKAIIKNKTEHFDLLIAEARTPVVYGFAKRFKCPFIEINPNEGFPYFYRKIGSPSHPIINPDVYMAYSEILSFKERLISVTTQAMLPVVMYFYADLHESIVKKHFGVDYTDMAAFGPNASMLFVNSNPIFYRVRPLAPNVIQFGGGTHMKPAQPLPENLKSFLDGAKEGFIYFSLGSIMKNKNLSPKMINTFTETFSELPYKILWKFEENPFDNLPKNVMMYKWLPQQDVLRHPNIKLFINQGGIQSIEESLYCHVPIVSLPFAIDQFGHAKLAVNKGMGLSADPLSLNKENFKNIIMEVINNPKFRNRVKQLSDLINDQPMTGLRRAIWWTEYVIRHKGAQHFRSPVLDIPFYQYYLLDVILFYIVVIVVILYILITLLKLMYKICKFLFGQQPKIKYQ